MAALLAPAALVGASCALRWLTVPCYVESADGHNFVRSLSRYSIPLQQPHWPGYPVYVWLGKLLAVFVPSPVMALHVLSVLASSLAIVPIFGLAGLLAGGRKEERFRAGLAAGAVWLVLPVSWLTGSEIYSDAVAVLLAASSLWFLIRFLLGDGWSLIVASVLDGLMLGVRLAYLPLVLPLLYVSWVKRREPFAFCGRPSTVPAIAASGFFGAVALWLLWQLVVTGAGQLAVATFFHLVGHFVEWGNSVTAEPDLRQRVPHFLELFLYHALGAWWPAASTDRALTSLAWAAMLITGVCRRLPPGGSRLSTSSKALLLWSVPYLFWVFLIHDLSVIRYALPAGAALAVLVGCALPRRAAPSLCLLVALVSSLTAVSAPLAVSRKMPHVSQRISSFLAAASGAHGALLLTDVWTLNRCLWEQLSPGSNVTVRPVKDSARAVDRPDKPPMPERQVYALTTTPLTRPDAILVARFCHDRRVDPSIPAEVWLYRVARWKGDEGSRAIPGVDSGCAAARTDEPRSASGQERPEGGPGVDGPF